MAFTESEQGLIKYYLSYPDWVSLAQSFQLGYPAASQPLFLVDDAFKRLTPEGEAAARKALCQCEACECQLGEARTRLKAVKVGEIELNPHELKMVRRELLFWTTRLADALGVVSNPYSQMLYQGINAMGGVGGRSISS